ncbi:MAG: 16S rRNA processing protein RimM [Rhodocyclales bacterium GWA2_65_20]|nr:MAG: 16S rRNA processing protein RimM [Rhodocyclales bacterium GWA2_65_20]
MVVLGRIVVPYGIAGWVKIHPFGDDPVAWKGMPSLWLGEAPEGADWSPLTLKELRFHGKSLIAKFEGVDDRSAAERLDGCYVAAPREALPANAENEFYWGDLVGLAVVNEEGEALGTVATLIEAGANQVLVVRDADGTRERLLPFVAAVVKDVAVAAGRIRVAWGKDW